MSDDGGITRFSIGFNKIAAAIKVAPLYGILKQRTNKELTQNSRFSWG